MINPTFVQTMARYNKWQNLSLYTAADELGESARTQERGAYFGSIHKTLSHLLWGDRIWMSRFADLPLPDAPSVAASVDMIEDWEMLKGEREKTDQDILDWSGEVTQAFLDGTISWYSGSQKRDFTNPTDRLVVHMFNHQTHHRGQVHAMITAANGNPEDTDLFLLPS